jgi:hypothetical protein
MLASCLGLEVGGSSFAIGSRQLSIHVSGQMCHSMSHSMGAINVNALGWESFQEREALAGDVIGRILVTVTDRLLDIRVNK